MRGQELSSKLLLLVLFGVPTASPAQNIAPPSEGPIVGILSCSPLSTNRQDRPAFDKRLIFRLSGRTLKAEQEITGNLPGSESFEVVMNSQGQLKVSGRGERNNGSGGWTYTLTGRPQTTNETVFSGNLRAGWGKGIGTRSCKLSLAASFASLKATLSPLAELQRGQRRLERDQQSTAQQLDGVTKILGDIVLPVTEKPGDWMMRVAAIPVQQQQFCRIVDRFYDALSLVYSERNEIRKNGLFRDRQKDFAALLPAGRIENWVVRIIEVTQAADGSAAVMLQPPCRVLLGSDACSPNAATIRATIAAGSPMYRELERVRSGEFIVVSGRILYAAQSIPDQALPLHAVYQAGSHCSAYEGGKVQDVFVTEIGYLARLQ